MDDEHWAIDSAGHSLPYTPAQVKGIVAHALRTGNILAVLIEMKDGNLSCQVIGDPTEKIGNALIEAGTAYLRALKGQ